MIAELGSFALVTAFVLAIAQVGLSVGARLRGQAALRGAGEGAAVAAGLCVAVAFFCLMACFIRSDFSVLNVAQNSHTEKPLLYKIAGTWGSHEGSMMLWCLVLTGFGAIVAITGGNLPWRLKTLVIACQGVLGILFIGYTVMVSNPFLRLPLTGLQRLMVNKDSEWLQLTAPPFEGQSLNPLLQDPALAIHPPMLYLGYVGCSVVFSFAIAALIEGRVDAAWARWVRPWTLWAWSFLTIGITLGSFWSYYTLGWGGWWAWDPVENASFMPWLVATALLHSAVVTEKRGALKGWTVFLALAAFTFSMLGAFLVRSGVLTSVHAFAVDPQRGLVLLVMVAVAAGTGFSLFAWRAPKFTGGGVYSQVSRETTLILNNIFLAAAVCTVLLGTLYPLIVEALTGKPISVGTPYFSYTFVPLFGAALVILPAGPLVAWKRGDLVGALKTLWIAALIAVAAAVLAYILVAPGHWLAAGGALIGVWLICGSLTELAERAKVGKAPVAENLRRLGGLPRGAWGMTLAHLGLGVLAMGGSIETAGKLENAQSMRPGDSYALGAYVLRLDSVATIDGPNYVAERSTVTVTRNGKVACVGTPERRTYSAGGDKNVSAICTEGLDHVYVVMGERRGDETGQPNWLITGYFNPLAWLIFIGPFLMAVGGFISLSDRRLRMGVAKRAARPAVEPAPEPQAKPKAKPRPKAKPAGATA
jgi:cytochrome c-type biogenesis protein CcmF